MIKRGDIKALKIGRTVRISQEELDYLLKEIMKTTIKMKTYNYTRFYEK